MSFFKYLFDNDWWQRSDIEALRHEMDGMSGVQETARMVEARNWQLQYDLERLVLLNEALLRLLIRKELITSDEFRDIVREVDLEDGVEDGRLWKSQGDDVEVCATCKRPVGMRRRCVYCGTVTLDDGEIEKSS